MYLEKFFYGDKSAIGCANCRDSSPIDFNIVMAFQPIIDAENNKIYGYEALVRGKDGRSAFEVISAVKPENRYRFDQTCRVMAIDTASSLGLKEKLSINFMPNAVYEPASCIRLTLAAAKKCNISSNQIVFELSESEKVSDYIHLNKILTEYNMHHFDVAIDDFGSGYSGLNTLVNFKPNVLKLDMELIRNIHQDHVRAAVIEGILRTCNLLNIRVIAEGIEMIEEYVALRGLGVIYFQGFLFAKPEIEALPKVNFKLLTKNHDAYAHAINN